MPFRIPALGSQETRIYVLLLMIESIVGGDHAGFRALLTKAKEGLNKPWIGAGLSQGEVRAVDAAKGDALDAAFVLSAQIGPILAEGTKGNPRQIKRFLNALMVRQAIAKARGFENLISQPVLAKLMLAERFQPDFYDHLAGQAVLASDGKVAELQKLKSEVREGTERKPANAKKEKGAVKQETADDQGLAKWREREWLNRWLKLEPALSGIDLRPYIFVARDKRMLAAAAALGGLDGLIEKLSGSGMALRMVEPEVKALSAADAEAVFNALRERVLAADNFSSPPHGFDGLAIVAKHHQRFQTELVALLGSINSKALGIWVVKGWNEVLTDTAAKDQLNTVFRDWGRQDDNELLKRAVSQALTGIQSAGR